MKRTKQIIELFDIKKGKKLTKLYLKSDVILQVDNFKNFVKVSTEEYGIIPLYCVSLPGYTYQCAMKYTDIKLQTLRNKNLILLMENNIQGGIGSVNGDKYVKSDENKKILYMDATNFYGRSMSQMLPYDDIEMWHGHPDLYMSWLEEILNTPDENKSGYFSEVDLKYPDNKKEETKNFPFCPETLKINPDKNDNCMKKVKPRNYTKSKKKICDWTDEKNFLILYRMLNSYVSHGMVVEKIHKIISFKQSKWLEKFISFTTQNETELKMILSKTFLNYWMMLLLLNF